MNDPRRTLVLIHQHPHVLLGLKKRGFGEAKWNGFGGKIEEGESIEDAARREVLEESGLVVKDIEKLAVINFEFQGDIENIEGHVYTTYKFEGKPIETEEMKPKWFHVDDIPFNEMWEDDRYWFPYFLRKQPFHARFLFADEKTILEHDITTQ
jgi:8-oxo-dGTP diphosphatase/2-hydroxy-dATP diphosphatase